MKFTPYFLLAILLFTGHLHAAGPGSKKKAAQSSQNTTPQEAPLFHIFNPDTLAKPTAGYSQIAEVNGGKTIYISGQTPVDRSGNLVGKDDFRAQIQQVFENLKTALAATGGDFNSVIKLSYFCSEAVDPSQLPIMREVRDKYINTSNPPTSSFMVVRRLARPEWLIEVEAVAVVKK